MKLQGEEIFVKGNLNNMFNLHTHTQLELLKQSNKIFFIYMFTFNTFKIFQISK